MSCSQNFGWVRIENWAWFWLSREIFISCLNNLLLKIRVEFEVRAEAGIKIYETIKIALKTKVLLPSVVMVRMPWTSLSLLVKEKL